MRRFLLILLLLCVPFQMAWSSVSVYCQHETGSAAKHFGHHGHQHHATNGKVADTTAPSAKHQDCKACQAQIPAAIVPEIAFDFPEFITSSASHLQHNFALIFHHGPDRPNWVSAI